MTTSLPNEVVLKASPLKWIGILSLCALFVWGGFLLLSDGDNKLAAWICFLLFGVVGVPVSLFQLIRPGRLTLDEKGFEQVMMGRSLKCNWHDVSDFGVMRVSRNKFVSFSQAKDEGKVMANLSKTITGNHSGALGDTFGMKAKDLAELMNAFRDRALSR